jgi:8-oxo-dGTP pyrophosphatase MutT (NUDIX family)
MKREKSCGAVVYRRDAGRVLFLLIRHRKGGFWSFPKGHVEEGEDEEATALREVREETGLAVTLLPGFRERITYPPKPGVSKDVLFFLAENGGGAAIANKEVSGFAWLTYEAARSCLTYKDSKKVLEKAHAFLTSPRGA